MSTTLEALQAEVLRLSPSDRARLLIRLIASLDVDAQAEAAWDAVADEREGQLQTGEAQTVSLDVAMARLGNAFPRMKVKLYPGAFGLSWRLPPKSQRYMPWASGV